MLKKIVVILSVVVIIFGAAVLEFYKFQQLNHPYLGIDPEKLPRVITDKILEKHNSERETTYSFSGKNLLTRDKLPKGFDPSVFIDMISFIK